MDICRVCMQHDGSSKYIFNPTENNIKSIYEKITYCTGLEITKDDGLPSLICEPCLNDLSVAYKFKTTCIQTDELFRSRTVKVETIVDNGSNKIDIVLKNEFVFFNSDAITATALSDSEHEKYEEDASADGKLECVKESCMDDLSKELSAEFQTQYNEISAMDSQYCYECNIRFKTDTELFSHNLLKHNTEKNTRKKQQKCDKCNLFFKNRQETYRHRLQMHSDKATYECNECNNKFKNGRQLLRHRQEKHPDDVIDKNFQCNFCNLNFKLRHSLNYHIRQHHKAPTLSKCSECNIDFPSDYFLYKHKKEKHNDTRKRRKMDPNRKRVYRCKHCQIEFSNSLESENHRRAMHKKPRICEICGVHMGHQYKQHLLYHFPPKFWCAHCSYKSASKYDLKKHLSIHFEDSKTFCCDQCPYRSRFSSNLHQHIRAKHQKLKNFACHLCDSRFSEKRALNEHVDSHNSIKRFHCDICDTRFSRRDNYRKHLVKQHGVAQEPSRPGRKRLLDLLKPNDDDGPGPLLSQGLGMDN